MKPILTCILILTLNTGISQRKEVWLTTNAKYEEGNHIEKVVDLILQNETILNIDSTYFDATLEERGRRGRYLFSLHRTDGTGGAYLLLLDMRSREFFLIRRRSRETIKFYTQTIK